MCLCVLNDTEGLQLKQNLPNFHWVRTVKHIVKGVIQDAQYVSSLFLHNTCYGLTAYLVKKNTVA